MLLRKGASTVSVLSYSHQRLVFVGCALQVSSDDAVAMAKGLAVKEGLLVSEPRRGTVQRTCATCARTTPAIFSSALRNDRVRAMSS